MFFLHMFLTSLSDRSPCSKLNLSFNSFSSFLVHSSSSVFSRSSLSLCSFRRSMIRSYKEVEERIKQDSYTDYQLLWTNTSLQKLIHLFCKRFLQCCESSVSIGSVSLQRLYSLLQAAHLLLLVPQLFLQVLDLQ